MSTAETQLIHANGSGAPLVLAPDAGRDFLTDGKVELLRRTICAGATDDEMEMFIAQCRRTGLDPFVRQIHAVKRWNAGARRDVMTIQVGIDGLRLIAERTGNYAPGQDTEYVYDKAGGLVKATAYVKKFVHGEWHVVPGSALWAEYCQTTKEGQPMAMWGKLPHVMLEKCAEARALRRAFPQETSGLYIHEEMAQADSEAPPAPRPGPSQAPAPPRFQPPRETGGPSAPPRREAQNSGTAPACVSCGKALTPAQATLSHRNYGEALCPTCQKKPGQAAPAPRPVPPPIDQEADDFEDILGPDPAQGEDDPFADGALPMRVADAGPGHGD